MTNLILASKVKSSPLTAMDNSYTNSENVDKAIKKSISVINFIFDHIVPSYIATLVTTPSPSLYPTTSP